MESDDGRWVVPGMVRRLRAVWGIWYWNEYEEFAAEHGIRIVYHEDACLPRAYHVGRVVFARRSKSQLLAARAVWHEISHILAFPLNWQYWEAIDWGELVISQTERRNNDFAAQFPVWDSDLPLSLS